MFVSHCNFNFLSLELIKSQFDCIFVVFSIFNFCDFGFGPENDPEAVLRDFIHKQFNGKLTREDVLKKTTGELFKEYSKMTDDTFRDLFLQKKLTQKKLKIVHTTG